MRRVLNLLPFSALAAVAVMAMVMPTSAEAQSQRQRDGQGQQAGGQDDQDAPRARAPRLGSLRSRPNAGPCPYVKVLYDAARYVELTDNRAAVSNVGYTGEIQGLSSGCAYSGDQPITVNFDVLFNLGRGPQATGNQHTYRYWVAVTERNTAVLAKEYFDLPVDFKGAQTASVTQRESVTIPRKDIGVSGSNFEVLIGFEVTQEMAEFNRTGSRFRVNAGSTPPAPAAPAATTPPAN